MIRSNQLLRLDGSIHPGRRTLDAFAGVDLPFSSEAKLQSVCGCAQIQNPEEPARNFEMLKPSNTWL